MLDGYLATGRADLTLDATLADIAALAPGASGRAQMSASLVGQDGPIAVLASLAMAEGQLADLPLSGADLRFAGTLEGEQLAGNLAGNLTGSARLGEAPVDLAAVLQLDRQTQRLSDLDLSTTGARLTGALSRSGDALLEGQLVLDASDISTASRLALLRAQGALQASIALSPQGQTQQAAVEAVLRNVRYEGVSIASANVSLTIEDALATPRLAGSGTASGLVVGDVTIAQLRGQFDSQRFTLSLGDVLAPALRASGVGAVDVVADGSFMAGGVNLERATLTGARATAASASGVVPFAGPGLNLAVEASLPLSLANGALASRGGQLSGTMAVNARVTGSLDEPVLAGSVSSSGGTLVDPPTGLRLRAVALAADLAGDALILRSASAQVEGGGSLSASGRIDLDPDAGLPADLDLRLASVRYADGSLVVATASGALAITGPLARGPLIAGTLTIEQAELQVPDTLGGTAGLIEVVHVQPSQRVREAFERARDPSQSTGGAGGSSPVRLDLTINAPNRIFVRGRGLDAELGGQVRLTGPLSVIAPVGSFNLIRGRLSILGQRITLDEGSLTLIGDLDPFLTLIARTSGDDIIVEVAIRGRISQPQITLSSQPQLPQDEVLARLIFQRSLNELSPFQIAQLAAAAAELAGTSDASLLGNLRDSLGLADLDIITDETGNPAVRATQYVQENVYVGLEAGTGGQTRATINLDITEDLTARGSVDSQGRSSVGIFFERDY